MAIIHPLRLWPYKTIPYLFSSSVKMRAATTYRDSIFAAMKQWSAVTDLRFMPYAEYFPKYVAARGHTPQTMTFRVGVDPYRIIKSGDLWDYRAHSSVGMTSTGPTIVASAHSDVETVAHEMGHALGLKHEQTRPDRDSHVIVVRQLMSKAEYDRNYAIAGPPFIPVGPYDPHSLMHYPASPPSFMAKDGNSASIGAKPRGIAIGGPADIWISLHDAAAIQQFYKGKDYL